MLPDALSDELRASCGEALLLDARRGAGIVSDIERLYETCQRLSNAGFSRCIDLTAVHLDASSGAGGPARHSFSGTADAGSAARATASHPMFQMYLLLRHPAHAHCSLQLKWKYTQTDSSFHPSLSRIWPSAGLAERELWELLGIAFTGNDSLFPLLLDPQFEGYPLRRDFVLPRQASYAEHLLQQRFEQGLLAQAALATDGAGVQSAAPQQEQSL